MSAPIIAAAGPTKGSWLILLLRIFAGLVLAVPAFLAASGPAGEAAGSVFYTGSDAMPFTQFSALFGEVMENVFGAWGFWVLLGVAFKFFLDGAALNWFADLARNGDGGRRVWRIFGGGWNWFWSMFRIGLVAFLLLGLGLFAAASVGAPDLDPSNLTPDDSAYDIVIKGPMTVAAVIALWGWLVGALALHAKAAAVAAGRKNTFAAIGKGFGTLIVRPLQGTLFYIVLTALVTALSAWVIAQWRFADVGGGDWSMWAIGWLGTIVVQAYAWHWLARTAAIIAVQRSDAGSAPVMSEAPAAA